MALNRVTLSGATGLIGRGLARRLAEQGVALTVLSRSPERARTRLQDAAGAIEAVAWDPLREPAPPAALQGSDAVVHLAVNPPVRCSPNRATLCRIARGGSSSRSGLASGRWFFVMRTSSSSRAAMRSRSAATTPS